MTTFDDRENAFENKYAHDAEMQFKAEARRNKLLGLWAATLLGKSEADAKAYAMDVVKADFEEAGDEDVYRKLAGDLGGASTRCGPDRAQCRAAAELVVVDEHLRTAANIGCSLCTATGKPGQAAASDRTAQQREKEIASAAAAHT